MQGGAEHDAQPCQQHAQRQHPQQGDRVRRSGNIQRKSRGGQAHAAADPDPQQGRDQARQQRRILHGADVDDLDHKNGGGQRRAEDGGKRPRHAAHGQQAAAPGVQLEQTAEGPQHRAAQQQGRALPAAGAAQQMGDYGGEEDQRRRAQRQQPTFPHRGKDLVGGTAAGVEVPVQKDDGQAAQRQQEQQPALLAAQGVGPVQRQAEGGPQRPGQAPGQHGQRQPFAAHAQIPQRTADGSFRIGHIACPPGLVRRIFTCTDDGDRPAGSFCHYTLLRPGFPAVFSF